MPDVPPSVLTALWANAVIAGDASASHAAYQVERDGDRHLVRGQDLPFSAEPSGPFLVDWFDALADGPTRGVRAVLPAPGDLVGVPAAHVDDVLDAGEAVVTMSDDPRAATWLLVPSVEVYGSELEQGETHSWVQHRLDPERAPRQVATMIGAAEADRHLTTVLLASIEQLGEASGWLPGVGRGMPTLEHDPALAARLPRSLPARAVSVLGRALWLRALVAAAVESGAVGGWDGPQRERVLRDLDTAARQAMIATTVPAQLL